MVSGGMTMISISSAITTSKHDDRILPVTRIVSAIIVPFLVLAFLILYFYPDESGQRFAWAIYPRIQAMYVGAGYLGAVIYSCGQSLVDPGIALLLDSFL
jgi:hypothetical protein